MFAKARCSEKESDLTPHRTRATHNKTSSTLPIKIDLVCAKVEGWLSSGHCVNDGQKNMLLAPKEKHIAKVALSASEHATAPLSPSLFSSSPRAVKAPLAL